MISLILIGIIAIFFPPVAVFIMRDCGSDLVINILLTILGYFPGHIHAFYILFQEQEARKARKFDASAVRSAPLIVTNNGDYEQNAGMTQASNVAYPVTGGQTVGRT